MGRKFIALEDPELKCWLLELIADPSASFLCALAEAVLTADPEDYAVVRPCLIQLKEKYRRGAKKTPIHRERPAQRNTLAAMPHRSRASKNAWPLSPQIKRPRFTAIEILMRLVSLNRLVWVLSPHCDTGDVPGKIAANRA